MIDKAFAKALKQLRKQKGLTQEALAFEVGIHRTYVSQLERGQKSPSLKTLHKVSQVFAIRLSELMLVVEAQMDMEA